MTAPTRTWSVKLLTTDGKAESTKLVEVNLADRHAIAKAIGCKWIELVRTRYGRMYVDEEAKLRLPWKPINQAATAQYHGGTIKKGLPAIHGNALLMTEVQFQEAEAALALADEPRDFAIALNIDLVVERLGDEEYEGTLLYHQRPDGTTFSGKTVDEVHQKALAYCLPGRDLGDAVAVDHRDGAP